MLPFNFKHSSTSSTLLFDNNLDRFFTPLLFSRCLSISPEWKRSASLQSEQLRFLQPHRSYSLLRPPMMGECNFVAFPSSYVSLTNPHMHCSFERFMLRPRNSSAEHIPCLVSVSLSSNRRALCFFDDMILARCLFSEWMVSECLETTPWILI